MKQQLAAMVAVLGLGVSLAACGGDDSASSASDAKQSSGSGGSKPSGKPIPIGFTTTDTGPRQQPGYADGFEAWVDQVNGQGGIDGRPVEMVRCDTEADATKTTQCVQSFIDNPDMPVATGWGALLAAGGIDAYAQAKMPYISFASYSDVEYTAPTGISLLGSYISVNVPMLQYAKDEGAESVVFLRADIAGTVDAAAAYKAQAEALGLKWLGDVPLAIDAPDVLPSVTAALKDDPDLVLTQIYPAQNSSTLSALATLGSDAKLLAGPGAVTSDVWENPDAAGRLLYPTPFAERSEDDPDSQYLEDRFGDELSDVQIAGYVAGRAVQQALEETGGGDATRSSVLDFVLNGTFKDLPWLPASISRTNAPAKYPALANVAYYVLEGDGNGGWSYVSDLIQPDVDIFS
jgi:ABC-type branched-subunit amino acid transport system substrate-binding protein